MKHLTTTLLCSFIAIAGIIGYMIGYASTPEYRLSMYDKSQMDLGRPDKWLDLRYVNAMIAHHRDAMLLAQQAQASAQRPETKALAEEILKNEPGAIAELYAWKKVWYGDSRPVQDPAVSRLGSGDDTFDLRFLNALIAHHESGLSMTKEVRAKSSRTEVLNNADAVENFLTTTLVEFKGWRKDWYNI